MMTRLSATILFIALGLLPLGGCATSSSQAAADRTQGLRLDLFMTARGDRHELYRVDTDGTLHFGGGRSALQDQYTWNGPLTDDEITALHGVLDAHKLWTRDAVGSGDQAEARYTFSVRDGDRRNGFVVKGRSDAMESVRSLLEMASRRRLDDYLERLPRPDLDELQPADAEPQSGPDAPIE